jgi:hypothetical protein
MKAYGGGDVYIHIFLTSAIEQWGETFFGRTQVLPQLPWDVEKKLFTFLKHVIQIHKDNYLNQ